MMRFTFYGGAGEVGKSCILLDSGRRRVLMDCGIKLSSERPEYPAIPDDVDAFILSHAHLDHCGMVPALYKKCLCSIYGTDLTLETSHILQKDSLKVTLQNGFTPEYDYGDIGALSGGEVSVPYREPVDLGGGVSFELFDAGHIPGSSSVLLDVMDGGDMRRVLYTGDIKTSDTHLLRGAEVPEADVLIIESTYGNRNHPDRRGLEKRFVAKVSETLERGGNALVAAFAVGRTQEMLLLLEKIGYPVFLDGMGSRMTKLFLRYPGYLRDADALRRAGSSAVWVKGHGMRNRAIREPSVIVTTAGMLSGGPVLSYLKRLHRDRLSTLFLTGYQVEGTNGRLLMDEGYVVDPWSMERISVDMEKQYFDFSAHAGRDSLEEIVRRVGPETCILVHGEPESCSSFGEWTEKSCKTFIPGVGESIEV